MPELDELLELLMESKREHTHCEDVWYCCRACRHPDHMLVEGEHIGDGIIERAGTYRQVHTASGLFIFGLPRGLRVLVGAGEHPGSRKDFSAGPAQVFGRIHFR